MMDWTNKLKNKMEGYTEQPSDSVWAGISAATGLTGNKHRAVPLWLLASSAIAAAALFGAMLIFNAKEDIPATMTAEAVKSLSFRRKLFRTMILRVFPRSVR